MSTGYQKQVYQCLKAKACQVFCEKYNACSLEIIQHSIEAERKEI